MGKACLILSDGTVFEGKRFGADRDAVCEVVFCTGSTGYLELLTDPSFAGQAVTMASPIVGNYGVFEDTSEAAHPWVGALIVRDITTVIGDERDAEDLSAYLKRNNIPGISGIDTRALTIMIREEGTMIGLITDGSKADVDMEAAKKKIEAYDGAMLVPTVSRKEKTVYPSGNKGWNEALAKADRDAGRPTMLVTDRDETKATTPQYRIALMDFGAKHNIIWNLTQRDCEVIAYPWDTSAEEILADKPDGVFLSNGPGNPKNCETAIREIAKLYESGTPIMGICLGHQLTALATGSDTHKLRYGHRGGNHPVKDIRADRVYITSQNHGYVVTEESIPLDICEISHINMNDGSIEGLRYKTRPVFTVQYHPEAAPGPWDNSYLFQEFFDMIEESRKKTDKA